MSCLPASAPNAPYAAETACLLGQSELRNDRGFIKVYPCADFSHNRYIEEWFCGNNPKRSICPGCRVSPSLLVNLGNSDEDGGGSFRLALRP
jgi:hypothetical protein